MRIISKAKFLVILFFFLGNYIMNGQTVSNFSQAQKLALADNKLIILDFWATWFGPCHKMDIDLWRSPEFRDIRSKFTLAKINIDTDNIMAMRYGVRSISRVVIITANEDRLFDKTGFRDAHDYLYVLEAFPDQLFVLNQKMEPLIAQKKASPESMFYLSEEYAKIANAIERNDIKQKFISRSNFYFGKCEKKSDSKELRSLATLSKIRNEIYLENYGKAMKKLKKINIDKNLVEPSEMINYLLSI